MLKISCLPERMQNKIMPEPMSGCWIWLGARQSKGYGIVHFKGENCLAHRTVYSILIGKIVRKFELDHLCRNRSCVNPQHLEQVTHLENCLRSPLIFKQPTHCPKGHAYNKENSIMGFTTTTKRSYRICRKCHRIRCKEQYERRRRLIKIRPKTCAGN